MKNNIQNQKDTKSERVIVHVRIRPFTPDELEKDKTSPIENVDTKNNAITIRREYDKKNFSYDTIFPMQTQQDQVFSTAAKKVVDSVLDGYNGTIFAYGQTGTGKTYTMVGEFDDNETKGIIPRSFDYIFNRIKQIQKQDIGSKFSVQVAFIQIYLETIQDLLEPSNQVRIREDPETGVYLENVMWIKVTNTAQCADTFRSGEKNRVTECTKMNAHSSRSHALLIAKIEKNFEDKENQEHVMTKSMLYLVDLAGSERVAKTKSREMRLEEAKKINYSLLVLGNCIQSLTDPKCTHVSYRDSKLTRILQESLGGNAKTSLIVTISPSNYNAEETVSSLNFGLRAMKVQNKPIINKTEDYQAQCFKLQEDYDKLIDAYSKLKIEYDKVVDENNKLKNSETFLDMQRRNMKQKIENSASRGEIGKVENVNEQNMKEMEDMKKSFREEMKKMETFYEQVIKNQNNEHDKVLKEIDDVIVKKEEEVEILKQSNNELSYKAHTFAESLNDVTKEKDDLQKSMNDMLLEKQTLMSKISVYTTENEEIKANLENLKKKMKEDEVKRSKNKIASIQTETLIDQKTKDLLIKIKVSKEDIIMNRYDKILNQLITTIDTLGNDANINTLKIKKLNDSIAIITKSYDDKLNKANDELSDMREKIKKCNEEKVKNDPKIIKDKYEKDIGKLQTRINELEQTQTQKQRELSEFQNQKKIYDKKIYEIQNDNKLLAVNVQSANSDYKQLQNNYNLNEKNLNKNLIMLMNDIALYNQCKKEIKKLDIIFESDLPSVSNNKGYEFFMSKVRNQLAKFNSMLEDLTNEKPMNTSNIPSFDFNKSLEKLNDNLIENKNLVVSLMTSYTKLSKCITDNITKNSKFKSTQEQTNEIASLEKNANKKTEQYIKNGLILMLKQNITKFTSKCYNKKVDDLNMKVNTLSSQIDHISPQELIKNSSSIFEELILRICSFKDAKELEIENLNEKIIYLLRELEIYRQSANKSSNSKTSPQDTLLNQLNLKNEEINRLNKAIQDNLATIKTLTCENSLLKSKEKTEMISTKKGNSSSSASTMISFSQSQTAQELEAKNDECRKEIEEINNQLAILREQQLNENIDKEFKHKNEYYKERLKKNIKKK